MIKIDSQKCIGCGSCVSIDPDTFQLNSTTFKAEVKKQQLTSQTKQAVEACPVAAISIK